MESKERLINWLETNQNNPIEVVINVYELSNTKIYKKGFKLSQTPSSYEIVDEDTKDNISLFISANDKIDFIVGKGNTEMETDAELTINNHFMISFNFMK